MKIQFIALALGLFFIILATYKALSQKASKRASAAKSLAQSKVGQDPNVSLYNPFPNSPLPEAPRPPDAAPQTPPQTPPPAAANASAPPPAAAHASAPPPDAVHAPAPPTPPPVTPTPEEVYKWN